MTLAPSPATLVAEDLPPLPGRELTQSELKSWVRSLAARPELWRHLVHHDGDGRHYVSL